MSENGQLEETKEEEAAQEPPKPIIRNHAGDTIVLDSLPKLPGIEVTMTVLSHVDRKRVQRKYQTLSRRMKRLGEGEEHDEALFKLDDEMTAWAKDVLSICLKAVKGFSPQVDELRGHALVEELVGYDEVAAQVLAVLLLNAHKLEAKEVFS